MSTSEQPVEGREPDYLWDGRGAAPEDIARLEALLRPYRYDAGRGRATSSTVVGRVGFPRRTAWLAVAAVVAVAAGVSVLLSRGGGGEGWQVSEVQGAPRIAGAAITEEGTLSVGDWLHTDAASSAVVSVAGIGQVTVEPGSRVRLVGTGPSQHRMELAQGKIEAFITAPPKLFFVDTPSAVAVDYGCMYTLAVQPDGSTLLHVTLGLVKLVSGDIESAVPRGLVCRSVPGRGPGVPYDPEADPKFIAAVAEIDSAAGAAPPAAVAGALAAARARDRVTLWHLLRRVDEADRPAVYARLAAVAPPPPDVTLKGVSRLDPAALDAWWRSIYQGF